MIVPVQIFIYCDSQVLDICCSAYGFIVEGYFFWDIPKFGAFSKYAEEGLICVQCQEICIEPSVQVCHYITTNVLKFIYV